MIIGNLPYIKLPASKQLQQYRKNYNDSLANNTAAFFIEKSCNHAEYVAFILPKIFLCKPEYKECRTQLSRGFTQESAVAVERVAADNESFDFFVNMENIHLRTETKPFARDEAKTKLYKARYKYSMVLVGLSILGYYANNPAENESPEEKVRVFSQMISPVILPMIEVMGSDMGEYYLTDRVCQALIRNIIKL